MQRSGKDFTIMKVLPSGVYQYRFLVDGQWRHSPDLPWEQDDSGNAYNVLDLQVTFPIFNALTFYSFLRIRKKYEKFGHRKEI